MPDPSRRPLISVLGSGTLAPDDPRRALATELGTALIDARYRILCGARGGVMEAVAAGGRASAAWIDGDILGLLPGNDPSQANPYIDVVLPTGLGHARNALIAQGDAVVAIGGGAGTLSELALAWTFKRPCLAYRCAGWSGKLADTALDDTGREQVIGVDDAAGVIAVLDRLFRP